ncbi:MAG: LptF/LptG family permease [bacterium]
MKIIHRYIIKEILPPVVLGLFLFTFILLLDRIFDLIDLYFKQGVRLTLIIKMLLLIIPSMFSLTIPMAILLGCLLGFGRLSEDGEITAFRSAGQSLWHIMWPVLLISAIISAYLLFFNSSISPRSHNAFKKLYREALQDKPLSHLEEKSFMKLPGYYLFINSINNKTNSLRGIQIYKLNYPAPPEQIFAREGTAKIDPDAGLTLFLKNGSIQQLNKLDPTKTIFTSFKDNTVTIPFKESNNESNNTSNKNLRSSTNLELKELMIEYRSKNLPVNYIKTELFLRQIMAFTPILFAIIGTALGIRLEKSGKSFGFAISLLILFAYYLLLIGAISFSEKNVIPPFLSMWLPNIIIGAYGVYLFLKVLKK